MRELMLTVIQRALAGADQLPADQRADLYEGIAQLCEGHLADIAITAGKTATSLREAEQQQLTFAALLRA